MENGEQVVVQIVGMCVVGVCSEPVLDAESHLVLCDGSPIHMECVVWYNTHKHTDTAPAHVHRFRCAGLLPIPVANLHLGERWLV